MDWVFSELTYCLEWIERLPHADGFFFIKTFIDAHPQIHWKAPFMYGGLQKNIDFSSELLPSNWIIT